MAKINKALNIIKLTNNKIAKLTLKTIEKKQVNIQYLSKLPKEIYSNNSTKKYINENIKGLYICNTKNIYINSKLNNQDMANTIVHEIDHLRRSRQSINDNHIFTSELTAHIAEMKFSGKKLNKNSFIKLCANIIINYNLFTKLY